MDFSTGIAQRTAEMRSNKPTCARNQYSPACERGRKSCEHFLGPLSVLRLAQFFGARMAQRNVKLDLATIRWVRRSKTTYSPGDSACRSSIRDLALCKSCAASSHRKFTSSIFSRMSNGDFMVAPPGDQIHATEE